MTRERGATYLVLLLALAFAASVLASTATIWSHAQQREREKQLLWAGEQFRQALLAYSKAGNGTYPRKLEDLLEDPRTPAKRRFLRQIYEDPMTRSTDWALVRNPLGGIVGVHSRSEGIPIKRGQFPEQYARFEHARAYSDWKFAAVLPRVAASAAEKTPEGENRTSRSSAAEASRAQEGPRPDTASPPALKPASPAPAASTPKSDQHAATSKETERTQATIADRTKPNADEAQARAASQPSSEGATKPPAAASAAPSNSVAQPTTSAGASSSAAQSAVTAPAAPPSATAPASAATPSTVFAPSPLTPLQSLQSPFAPERSGGSPSELSSPARR